MKDLSLHILDIAQNSIQANATKVEITIAVDPIMDTLTITINDNGIGMTDLETKKVCNPFYTTSVHKSFGFGVPFFEYSAKRTGGSFLLNSKKHVGTTVCAIYKLCNIDRSPLGDVASTLLMLMLSNPQIQFALKLSNTKIECAFSSLEVQPSILKSEELIYSINKNLLTMFGGILDEIIS